MFVDEVQIEVWGGRGGNGCLSFRREKYIPRGGPDGGDGGRGGSVVMVAHHGVDHLSAMAHKKHWKAEHGTAGGPSNCYGRHGEDLVIQVPLGTLIYDAEQGHLLGDLTEEGASVVVAKGGRCGFGNVHFKTSIDRAPRTVTEGGAGEKRLIRLELKMIADVGLVGKPNAGKSTLLTRLSRARPEVAPYPFTTKHPFLGQVRIDFDRTFFMADIPGLIEGASQGAGLGHEFLRHIERAGILVHLVEPAPDDQTDPWENYLTIRNELQSYREELGRRPEIVVVTKQDLPEGAIVKEFFEEKLGRPVLAISAPTGEGLRPLVDAIVAALETEKTRRDADRLAAESAARIAGARAMEARRPHSRETAGDADLMSDEPASDGPQSETASDEAGSSPDDSHGSPESAVNGAVT